MHRESFRSNPKADRKNGKKQSRRVTKKRNFPPRCFPPLSVLIFRISNESASIFYFPNFSSSNKTWRRSKARLISEMQSVERENVLAYLLFEKQKKKKKKERSTFTSLSSFIYYIYIYIFSLSFVFIKIRAIR